MPGHEHEHDAHCDSCGHDHVRLPAPYHAEFRPGRNDPCWCGSGLKYKRCHLEADSATVSGSGA